MCDRACQRKIVPFPQQGQSKKMSLVETIASTVIGFVVAILSQYAIFPLFDIYVPLSAHLYMSIFFTVVSIIRGYLVRRLFNKLHIDGK